MKVRITINASKDGVEITVENENWRVFNENLKLHSEQTLSESIAIEIKNEDFLHVAEEVRKYVLFESSAELYYFFTNTFATILKPGQAVELEAFSFLGVQCPYCGMHTAQYIVKLPRVFGEKTTMYCGKCFKVVSQTLANSQQRKEVLA